MNKKRLAVILVIVLAALVLLVVALQPGQAQSGSGPQSAAMSQPLNVPEEPASSAGQQPESTPEPQLLDVNSIPGFLNGAADGQGAVCGLALPYRVPDTDLFIEGIGQYSGPFVEDGTDEPTANALALVVRNSSAALAEYAELTFTVNGGEQAVFSISGVPGGEYALVLEKNGRPFSAADALVHSGSMYAVREDVSMQADKMEVYSADGALTVKNITDQALNTVYIRYKSQLIPHCYLGGITYSCKLEGIPAGQEKTAQTGHFSSNSSQIVMVEAIN